MRILSSLPQRDGCRDSLQGGPKLPRNRLPHSPSSLSRIAMADRCWILDALGSAKMAVWQKRTFRSWQIRILLCLRPIRSRPESPLRRGSPVEM